MENLRRKSSSEMTEEQNRAKASKDKEYEKAVCELSNSFYQKKRSVGVSSQEEMDYQKAKTKLWNDYETWALSNGLYEEIDLGEQERVLRNDLVEGLQRLNSLRKQLGMDLLGEEWIQQVL